MNKKIGTAIPCFALIFGTLFSLGWQDTNAVTQTGNPLILYDAASGNIPKSEMMNFIDFPPSAAPPIFENGATLLNTSASGNDTYAGWVSTMESTTGFPLLDPTAGFQVNFSLQLEDESHSNNNRAGFSLIILGNDAKGIELAFWGNEIWAQNDDLTSGLFTHGEAATLDTTAGLVNYQLNIINDSYNLTANGVSILMGPVRDYSAFEGFPDPYQTPNFLFIGDNTTSAQARIRLSYVSITGSEPAMPITTPTNTPMDTPTNIPTSTPTIMPTVSPAPIPTDVGPCSLGTSIVLFLIFLNYFLAGNHR